jgi:hypothetical protein
MPDTTVDRQREQSATKRLSTDQVNRALATAVKDVTTGRHPTESQHLDRLIDRLLQAAGKDKQLVESFAAVQQLQLKEKQRLELDTLQRLQTSADADVHGELEQLRSTTSAINQRMSEDRAAMRAALASPTQDVDRRAVIDEVLREQQGQHQVAGRVRLDRDASNVVRDRLNQTLGDRQLSEKAQQRIVDEAHSKTRLAELPAEAQLAAERAAVSRVKGQLFEELLELKIHAMLSELNKDRPADQQLEFIAGWRIRDEQNQKLTDGVLAWRDKSGKLNTVYAFEAKSGPDAARELYARVSDLNNELREVAFEAAKDLALDDVLGKQRDNETVDDYVLRQFKDRSLLTDKQLTDLDEATNRHFAELTSRRGRTEIGGQIQATLERLAEQDLLVDELPESLGLDRRRTAVIGVLPADVRKTYEEVTKLDEVSAAALDKKAFRVKVTAAELQRAAEAVVDELKRRGQI